MPENTEKDTSAKGDSGTARGMRGTGSQGTREREERITGAVGVENRKGELVDQGSTTSPKGGAGMGEVDQGTTSGIGGTTESDEE